MSLFTDRTDPKTDGGRTQIPENSEDHELSGSTDPNSSLYKLKDNKEEEENRNITIENTVRRSVGPLPNKSENRVRRSVGPSSYEVVERYEGYPFAVFKTEDIPNRAAQISALVEKGIAPLFPSEVAQLKADYPTGEKMTEHQQRVLHTLKLVMPDSIVLGASPALLTDDQVREREDVTGKPMGKKKKAR